MASYTVRRMLSKQLNDTVVVMDSQRQPGYSYKFNHTTKNLYRCIRCFELGKQRTIVVVDGQVVGRKNPEDDHHVDCLPQKDTAVQVLLWHNIFFVDHLNYLTMFILL